MPSQPVPLIRAGVLLPFTEFLAEIGAPVERLLAEAGLCPAVLQQPETLIPLFSAYNFAEHTAYIEGIENLGLVVGARTPVRRLGAFGELIMGAPTLWHELHSVTRTVNLYSSAARAWFVSEDECIAFHYHICVPATPARRHAHAFAVNLVIALIRQAAGPDWVPSEIRLPAREAPRRLAYEETFRTVVRFERDTCAVVFDRRLLSMPLRQPGQPPAASAAAHARLLASAPAGDFAGSIRQVVETLLAAGYPSVELAAKVTGLSIRTLQRRLNEAGTSYSGLVGQVRFDLARSLLQEGTVGLAEISGRLGYADPTQFTHAFKRWAGIPPRTFRLQVKTGESIIP
jgi:AraC-like DNA-binding protein